MAEIRCTPFGTTTDQRPVDLWTLQAGDFRIQVLSYGGILRSFRIPAPEGSRDLVLGCETLEQYEHQDKYFGALIGRVANRIGQASFDLEGQHYTLAANNGPNCLHGGLRGFNQAVWQVRAESDALVLSRTSPDGEEGFPGTLEATVTYRLAENGDLTLDYRAVSNQTTLCSLTNHSYFNLLGHQAGSLAGQQIQIFSDAFTETDADSLPTGRLLPVVGTPFDLREPTDFLEGLSGSHTQLTLGHGYDHNFVLQQHPCGPLRLCARATGGDLSLECWTTQPGLQLYTGNYLDGVEGKDGAVYGPRSAFCLETQSWPDAVHQPDFPSMVLPAGKEYRQTTIYRVRPLE